MKKPKTHKELIRFKKCLDLTRYYELSQDEVDRIYDYLSSNPGANIIGNKTGLVLKRGDQSASWEIINANCIDDNIDWVKLSNDLFSLVPHYVPSRSPSFRGASWIGRTNNNNNNNNS